MPSPRYPVPQGTFDRLILQIVSLESARGYGIAKRLEQISLDPALHRLQQKDWLCAEWRQSETGREAKFYSLRPEGRSGAVSLIFEEGNQ